VELAENAIIVLATDGVGELAEVVVNGSKVPKGGEAVEEAIDLHHA
jgi:hypothetical protein